ncbi:MAG: ParB/RepB/Spo0J family partition protein [Armatimonadota bacterium]
MKESRTGLAGSNARAEDDAVEYEIQMIPLESVRVLNPRLRNRTKFREIVASVADVGLKKPITVCPRENGGYDLVCGQGRLEAFRQLGHTLVPAIIRDLPTEDAVLMSLVENIARRKPTTMETVRQLALLRDRGYREPEIAKKTGLPEPHVYECLHLYDHGEERLLTALWLGRIGVASATVIARSEHAEVQQALLEAFEAGKIGQHELSKARVLADNRATFGKVRAPGRKASPLTGDAIVRAFQRERQKQRRALKKAQLCEGRLLFVTNALKMLFRDENFVNLLRAEGLDSLPEVLATKIKQGEEEI